jgi:hypothetical protein
LSRGFLTLGIDTSSDQIKYSYVLALSIKNCDKDSEVCLIVDKGKSDDVPSKYHHAFDYIVELPFGNTGHTDGFHGSNFWQLLYCTPFEENIYLDHDTIFNKVNVDILWEAMSFNDIGVSAAARTYRNIPCNKEYYFEIEDTYNLPKLYNQMFYFKRDSPAAIEWFKMADPVFQNWREVYKQILKDKKPPAFHKNILCNIVHHFLNCEKEIIVPINNYYDLDLRSQGLWHYDVPENWTDMLNSWYTQEGRLIIENSVIENGIIHYRDKKFLTQEVIDDIRTKATISDTRKAAT